MPWPTTCLRAPIWQPRRRDSAVRKVASLIPGGIHGNFESNPHDLVHVYVGWRISDTNYGLMADPGTAALDPIFYLHHGNIDRMWEVWNASGNPIRPIELA